MSDLSSAQTNALLAHRDGTIWRVLGDFPQPTIALQRIDCDKLAITDHTRLSLAPDSPWAAEWSPASDEQIEAYQKRLRDENDEWHCGHQKLRAQAALMLIERNGIKDSEAIELIMELIQEAGPATAADIAEPVPF